MKGSISEPLCFCCCTAWLPRRNELPYLAACMRRTQARACRFPSLRSLLLLLFLPFLPHPFPLHLQVVSRAEAEGLAKDYGIAYFETSAKKGIGVEEAFRTIAEQVSPWRSRQPSLQVRCAGRWWNSSAADSSEPGVTRCHALLINTP